MGFAARGQCFASVTDAGWHVCGTVYPIPMGTSMHSCTNVSVLASNQVGLTIQPTTSTGTLSPLQTWRIVFPTCDPLTWSTGPGPWDFSPADSALIAGAVAAAWIVAYAWRSLVRTVNTVDSPTE